MVEGTVGFKRGREKLVAGPGDEIVVEPGTAHKFWNAGDTEARFFCEIRPALQFERLIETMFGLAVDGKTNKKGPPQPSAPRPDREGSLGGRAAAGRPGLDAAKRARHGRPHGRLLGYGATYEPVVALRPAYA